jgi:hypothetical protein
LAAPLAVTAQTSLASLEIQLWPEFDKPSVLVLITGELAADTPLPATVTLQIPAEPFAVAERAPDSSLFNAEYVTASVGSEVAVTLTLQQPVFRLEYYDATLNFSGEARQYNFQWLAPVAANTASIRVQTPAQATGMQVQPSFGAASLGEYGLNYYTAQLGAISVGQALTAQVSYSKSGSALTVDEINVAQPEAAPASVITPTAAQDYTLWIVSGIILASVGLIAGAVWFSRRERPAPAPAKHHRARKPTPNVSKIRSANGATAHQQFCTQCGQPLNATDRFCRHCGVPVKASEKRN